MMRFQDADYDDISGMFAVGNQYATITREGSVAVPTSFGYGANFGGLSALLGMLTACAPGISVVNIDNGFGAGYTANLINRKIAREE